MNLDLERIAGTLHQSAFPRKIAVEITSACNLTCAMCHHPAMRRPKGQIPLDLWKKCADQIAAVSPASEVWFSFIGEPLLAPDRLLSVLAYGKSVGLRSLNLNSNGMLLTPELVEPILDSGVDLVVFGIDGLTRESYEQIRVGGIRDQVYANVERFLAARHRRGSGPAVQVQFIEMAQNAHELEAYSAYWLARGATLKVRKMCSWGGRFDTPVTVSKEERIPCPWAVTMMHLFWDGRVARCPGDTEGEEGPGNAWEEPLAVLWERLGVYREHHLNRRFDQLPDRCQTCKDWMVGEAQRIRSSSQSHPIAWLSDSPTCNACLNKSAD